jgi:hypothetical protein
MHSSASARRLSTVSATFEALLDRAPLALRIERMQDLRVTWRLRGSLRSRDYGDQNVDDDGQVRADKQDPDPVELAAAAHDVHGTGDLQHDGNDYKQGTALSASGQFDECIVRHCGAYGPPRGWAYRPKLRRFWRSDVVRKST